MVVIQDITEESSVMLKTKVDAEELHRKVDNDEVSSEGETSDSDDDDDVSNESEKIREKNGKSINKTSNTERSADNIVKNVLARDAEALKAITVTKPLELQYDLGNLLAVDNNDLNIDSLRKSKEEYLLNLARDNTQLLVNKIWQLPITRENTAILAKLPSPTYKLPREKPIPKPKVPTKWEKFAIEKGIRKTKRNKVLWDETLQKWVPRWGYKKAKADKDKSWAIEVRKNDDPYQDPFAKRQVEKQERVAKTEYQRLRNLGQAHDIKVPRNIEGSKVGKNSKKVKAPRMGLLSAENLGSSELKKALTVAKASTASLGKFQGKLPTEKIATNVTSILPMAKKRKMPVMKPNEEKKVLLSTVDGILKKKPKMDVEKAVNKQIHQEQLKRAEEKKAAQPKGKAKRRMKTAGKGKSKGRGQGKVRTGKKGGKHKGSGGKKK